MTLDDVRHLTLRRAGSNRGDIAAWCAEHGVAQSHLSAFLSGDKPSPARDLLDALDLEWRIVRKRKKQRTRRQPR